MSEPSHPKADGVDVHFMRLALAQARAAAQAGEVPIGAVLVNAAGDVLASAHNAPDTPLADSLAHPGAAGGRPGLGKRRGDSDVHEF